MFGIKRTTNGLQSFSSEACPAPDPPTLTPPLPPWVMRHLFVHVHKGRGNAFACQTWGGFIYTSVTAWLMHPTEAAVQVAAVASETLTYRLQSCDPVDVRE